MNSIKTGINNPKKNSSARRVRPSELDHKLAMAKGVIIRTKYPAKTNDYFERKSTIK